MKFKTKSKDCQLFIKAKTSFGENIDLKSIERFSRIYLRGFFKPISIKRNVIEYTGPVGISFYDRFKKPINKRDFLFVLEQIVAAAQKMRSSSFEEKGLVTDFQNVYINEVTKEVQFIYMPLTNNTQSISWESFFEAIAYSAKPADENDNEFVSRFVYYFRTLSPFDINKIEDFVAKEDKSVVDTIKRQSNGQSGFMTNKQQHYYEHYESKKSHKDEEATGLLDDEEATGLLNDDEATGLLVDEDCDEATGLLVEQNDNISHPTLLRVSTNELITVNKSVFRLGKGNGYVDYFVSDNIAVSRSHADIIVRNGICFVKDLNSRNHTYINENEIPADLEIEIHNGDQLRLGNEEFIFNI